MSAINILVVDDHALFRKGVILALKTLKPEWVFFEAENGEEALRTISQININLVMLDVAMPVMDGVETCTRLKQIRPDIPIVMLTQFEENALILHLLELGVNGFLLKNIDPEKLADAIQMVLSNGKHISEPMIRAMGDAIGTTSKKRTHLNLSLRDREILGLLSKGKSTKEIALEMHLTETSIESYRRDLLHKTCTHNVAELVSFAHRTGMLQMI